MPELQRSEVRPEFPLVASREALAIPRWFLIQSQPCKERAIQVRLDAERADNSLDVETFLPLLTSRRAGGRGENCPLFPSYLFSRFTPQDLPEINQVLSLRGRTVGAGRIVCFGLEPAIVDQGIIAGIRARCNASGFIDLASEQEADNLQRVQSLEFGDKVIVLSGAFQGQQGIFQQCKDGRVKALFGLLNVTVAAREIARA